MNQNPITGTDPSHVVGGSEIGHNDLETALIEAQNTEDFFQSNHRNTVDECLRLEVLLQSARIAERDARTDAQVAARRVEVATVAFDEAYDESAR